MELIQMKVLGISNTIRPADAYALVLEEVGGEERKLPIIIGHLEAQAIKVAMVKSKTPRPMTHDLMTHCIKVLDGSIQKVVIYDVNDGIFYAHIYLQKEEETICIDARTSDAIALALKSECAIYATQEIVEKEHLHDIGNGAFTININMIGMDMLEDALERAVKDENYEQASLLRDEINRRKAEKQND